MTEQTPLCRRRERCAAEAGMLRDAFDKATRAKIVHGPTMPDTVEELLSDSQLGEDRRWQIIEEGRRLHQEMLNQLPPASETCDPSCPLNDIRTAYGSPKD